MLFKISISFFYTQKAAYFVFKDSRSPVKASNFKFNPLNPRPTYAVSPTKPDQNMTNLLCTADYHAVPPLNIRLVESGITPTIFQPVEKLIPLTTTSHSGPDQSPLYFRPTYALPDQGPLIADPSIFPERERAGVDRLSGVNGPLRYMYECKL